MFQKIIHFVKYNNLVVLILLAFFLLGAGVFAQTEDGQQFIGQKIAKEEGVDNTLLLGVDLDKMNMDFKIEKIENDDNYYYVTYTYLDLIIKDSAWQYQLEEKNRKISKRINKDLGAYLSEEFGQQYQDRIRDLKTEKASAEAVGEQKRKEVLEYSGLIGKTLDVVSGVFPGYEAVEIREIPSPTISPAILQTNIASETEEANNTPADNLKQVYDDYLLKINNEVDNSAPIDDTPGELTPLVAETAAEVDTDNSIVNDVSAENEIVAPAKETESVEVITLPAVESAPATTPEGN